MDKYQSFKNSLRCLLHPFSLLCVTVLLLNDHVFKVINPSWLTGKLSDFSGLFYFPFVVAALLSLFLAKFNFTPEQLGKISFGLVAIWFILLKTFPPINYLTVVFSSLLVGSTTQFIMDWTDIMGLAVMFPAWKLWNQRREIRPTKLAYGILSIGTLAAIATSPIPWTVTSVTDLAYSDDGVIYAADRETFGESSYPVAKSIDGGVTWEIDNAIENLNELGIKAYPITKCLKQSSEFGSSICYRITSYLQLEISYDDETHWYAVFNSKDITIKARDLLIINHEDKECVIVAIGKGGILRRELPYGHWEIIEVLNAKTR